MFFVWANAFTPFVTPFPVPFSPSVELSDDDFRLHLSRFFSVPLRLFPLSLLYRTLRATLSIVLFCFLSLRFTFGFLVFVC